MTSRVQKQFDACRISNGWFQRSIRSTVTIESCGSRGRRDHTIKLPNSRLMDVDG
jgi:hypothetical protein